MTLRDAIDFAEGEGYDGAKKMPYKYKGMEVYEPYFNGKGPHIVGFPLVILAKGDDARMSTQDESLEVLDIHIDYCKKHKEFAKQYGYEEEDEEEEFEDEADDD